MLGKKPEDFRIKRKLSEVILPSEDSRPKEGIIQNDKGILVPTNLVNEHDWPMPCSPDDLSIALHYKALNRDSEFFALLNKGESNYVFRAELFQDETLFPGIVMNYIPAQEVRDAEITRILGHWAEVSRDVNVYESFYPRPREYCKFSVRTSGEAMTVLDFDLQLPFSKFMANYMISYIYRWIIMLFGGHEDELKRFIFAHIPIFGQEINMDALMPREIDTSVRNK